jgi:predicted secreted protein
LPDNTDIGKEETSMALKKTFLVMAGTMILSVSGLWAGDAASFVDLGFSPDGGVYMFAQYGVRSGALKPWADLFVVDVARNNFVSGGKVSYTHDNPIVAGQDGSGALYRLIARNTALADRYGISFPNQGQPLYIALDGEAAAGGESTGGESIEFRDFESRRTYRANLIPALEGSGRNMRSSFYIDLESSSDGGGRKTYTVGDPGVKRPLIASYHIKKVLIDPLGDSIVFVIEMKQQVEGGYDIRYMVETLRL